MITRSLLNVSHNTLHRRFCTSRPSFSFFKKVKYFLHADERDNFDKENVSKAHQKDNVSENEWKLIYRDIGASRTFYMTAALVPSFIVGAIIFAVDVRTNSPSNRFDFVQKLVTDAEELGVLLAFPSVALAIVVAFLIRVEKLRLIRIYQNKKNVEQFMAIRSKYIVTQHKELFRRDDAAALYFAEDHSDGAKVVLHFIFGNMQIGNRKFMIMDDMFKANNYRSYMLNETSAPPRLL